MSSTSAPSDASAAGGNFVLIRRLMGPNQARSNHERTKKLMEQNVSSAQELDDASAALKVAEANYEVAAARLGKTRIRSPLSGLVGRRLVSPGAFLRQGEAITEVAAVDVVKIAFAAPERYLALLRRGSPVVVSTTAYPGVSFTGKISVVNGQLVLNNTGITGPAVDLAPATATLDYAEKGGKQQLSGFGNNDAGPFSIAFSR